MNKKTITTIIDEIILKNKISDVIQDNITIDSEVDEKCSKSKQKGVIRAFQSQSEMHGLTFLTPDESGSAFTLYDNKNDVYLDFSNAFINKDIIDVKNNGEKEINLEDIFRGYDSLPDKVKKKIGLIKFHHLREGKDVKKGTEAFSRYFDHDAKTVGTITMPDYFFTKYNGKGKVGADNYENVLAHEAMHNYDYKKPSNKTFDLINSYFNNTLGWEEKKNILKNYVLADGADKYTKTYSGSWNKAIADNEQYLKDNGVPVGKASMRNRASDYGGEKRTENYAEAGMMVITGLHNPDNPNATVCYNGRKMGFREWVTIHPYQTQQLAKELYGENWSIDDILKLGSSTPLVPTS